MVETARKIAPLDDGPDWNFDLLEIYHQEIARVAKFYRLDTYPNQIEVITAEQMMDAYSSVGMPIGYQHWSFGKRFIHTERNYKRGQMGLAYEIVINSDPCIAYLMEENTMPMQALVMAHACYGHNSFSRTTTCSRPGPMPPPSSTTCCLPRTTSPNARKNTVSMPSSACLTPAMP